MDKRDLSTSEHLILSLRKYIELLHIVTLPRWKANKEHIELGEKLRHEIKQFLTQKELSELGTLWGTKQNYESEEI